MLQAVRTLIETAAAFETTHLVQRYTYHHDSTSFNPDHLPPSNVSSISFHLVPPTSLGRCMSSALCIAFRRASSRVNRTYINQFTSPNFGRQYIINPHISRPFTTPTHPTFGHQPKRPRIPFPTMSAISESDILARLDNLKITHEAVVEHEHCPGAAEWDVVLKGKDEWKGKSFSLSKTVGFPLDTDRPSPRTLELIVGCPRRSSCSSPNNPNPPPRPPSWSSPRIPPRPLPRRSESC